jgi:hypothetical protein
LPYIKVFSFLIWIFFISLLLIFLIIVSFIHNWKNLTTEMGLSLMYWWEGDQTLIPGGEYRLFSRHPLLLTELRSNFAKNGCLYPTWDNDEQQTHYFPVILEEARGLCPKPPASFERLIKAVK